MKPGRLEHANITVSDPDATAERLCSLFDWRIRWSGSGIHNGRSVHVGGEFGYLALYNKNRDSKPELAETDSYSQRGGLNHVGVVVDDLDLVEKRIIDAGFETFSHADYEPGRRFYFHNEDGIEFEVVSYD